MESARKINMHAWVFGGLSLMFASGGWAGPELATAREGVRLYREKQYEAAAKKFSESATADQANGVVQYNLGTALARTKEFDKAENALAHALNTQNGPSAAEAYYNLGYSQIMSAQGEGNDPEAKVKAAADPKARLEKLEKGLRSMRQAVLADPKDADAKYNYETAKLMIRQLKEQMQDPQGGGQNQDSKDGKEKQDKEQQNKDQQEQKDDQQGKEGQDKQDQQNEQQKQDGQQEPKPGEDEKQEQKDQQDESKQDDAGKEKGKEQEGKGEGKDQQQKAGVDQKPTPAATPGAEQTPGSADGKDPQPSEKQPTQEELDAKRVLNSLAEDKPEQFKKLFQFKGSRGTARPEKDW